MHIYYRSPRFFDLEFTHLHSTFKLPCLFSPSLPPQLHHNHLFYGNYPRISQPACRKPLIIYKTKTKNLPKNSSQVSVSVGSESIIFHCFVVKQPVVVSCHHTVVVVTVRTHFPNTPKRRRRTQLRICCSPHNTCLHYDRRQVNVFCFVGARIEQWASASQWMDDWNADRV